MSKPCYLTPDDLDRALRMRDLTDPRHGEHAMQQLLTAVVSTLSAAWGCTVREVRCPPIVAVQHNYDRLGYCPSAVTREHRYTRYLSPTTMLRSHTSADLPAALEAYRDAVDVDELIVVPGLVYRRDAVDRTHVGEPHQVDLWRICDDPHPAVGELLEMIELLVESVLPTVEWRLTDALHPYTIGGRQVDVRFGGEWLELAECGRVHPDVLRRSGLDPRRWSGLALGMGLERALMLRKGIPDIRYLRAADPRIASQMLDLAPWRHVSPLPAARRDISVVVDAGEDEETIGDRIRTALGAEAEVIESVAVLSRTRCEELPSSAQQRLHIRAGQSNLLLRIVLRPIEATLTSNEANAIRNAIYRAVHEGPVMELI